MDYIKIRFGEDLERLSSEFEKAIQNIFRPRPISPMFTTSERNWIPQMDIYETPDEIIILAELSGVKKEDLEVEINSKAVKIYGSRSPVSRLENSTYLLAEIQYGSFERILFFPTPIDTDKVNASFSNGFLQIRLIKIPLPITHKIHIREG
ncbi:MAG: heat-shock protein Hsp20 [Deltaproteobacteria bacterium RBG_13_49_15]|nr:MAG: heat-shock protein Hsp20 [Deltaproteobacteria bacterium RBG_13_49_15]